METAQNYLPFAKKIVNITKDELGDTVAILLDLVIGITEKMEPELAKLSKIKAKALFRDYSNLNDAGFSKSQAFKIILAQIKPIIFTDIISTMANTASNTKKIIFLLAYHQR